jgi:hypothetical protein
MFYLSKRILRKYNGSESWAVALRFCIYNFGTIFVASQINRHGANDSQTVERNTDMCTLQHGVYGSESAEIANLDQDK